MNDKTARMSRYDGYLLCLEKVITIIDNEIKKLREEIDSTVGGDASWQTFARIDALEDLKKRISCEQNEIKGVSEKAGEDSGNRAISDIPFPSRDLKNKLKEPEKEEVKK